jgi:hypothetical protein
MNTRRKLWALLALPTFLSPYGHAQQEDPADLQLKRPAPYRPINFKALKSSVFEFARIEYTDVAGPGQQAWLVDYPDAERNFTRHIAQLTGLEVASERVTLTLTDPRLERYPFIYLVEGGHLLLSDEEAAALRRYLLSGGFLMVDDFWGGDEWASLSSQLSRAFPELQPVELWFEHEVFWSFYALGERPEVPGIASVLAGSRAREAGEEPKFRGLVNRDGRLMAILLHNMDFGDAWEHVDDPAYPKEASLGGAIPMGINIVVYALSH